VKKPKANVLIPDITAVAVMRSLLIPVLNFSSAFRHIVRCEYQLSRDCSLGLLSMLGQLYQCKHKCHRSG
jgi:hypothetical protein